jgi:hypothetical protein
MLYPSSNSDELVVCVCDDNESELRMISEALPSAAWKVGPLKDADTLEEYGRNCRPEAAIAYSGGSARSGLEIAGPGLGRCFPPKY